jgi:hypothetical protein
MSFSQPVPWRPEVRFRWPVAPSGYSWHERRDARRPDRRLELGPTSPEQEPRITYPLAAPTALHRALAKLEPEHLAIQRFADAWGLLYGGLNLGGGRQDFGAWIDAITSLASAVALYEAINRADVVTLREWLSDDVARDTYEEDVRFGEPGADPEGLALFPSGADVALWPMEHVVAKAHERLLRVDIRRHLFGGAAPDIAFDEQGRAGRVVVMPLDLEGAAWLEFADAVLGHRTFRQCGACSQWFEVAPDVGRTDKRFCSDVCRVNNWRNRTGRRGTGRRA